MVTLNQTQDLEKKLIDTYYSLPYDVQARADMFSPQFYEDLKRLKTKGLADMEIGRQLGVSNKTVKKRFERIRWKTIAQKLDDSELVNFKELLLANSIQVDAAVQLLIEKGFFTQDEFFLKLKQVQAQYQKHESIR